MKKPRHSAGLLHCGEGVRNALLSHKTPVGPRLLAVEMPLHGAGILNQHDQVADVDERHTGEQNAKGGTQPEW